MAFDLEATKTRLLNDLDQGWWPYSRRDDTLDMLSLFQNPALTADRANRLLDKLTGDDLKELVDDVTAFGWWGPNSGGLLPHEQADLIAALAARANAKNLIRLTKAFDDGSQRGREYVMDWGDAIASHTPSDVKVAFIKSVLGQWGVGDEKQLRFAAGAGFATFRFSNKSYVLAAKAWSGLSAPSPEFAEVANFLRARGVLREVMTAAQNATTILTSPEDGGDFVLEVDHGAAIGLVKKAGQNDMQTQCQILTNSELSLLSQPHSAQRLLSELHDEIASLRHAIDQRGDSFSCANVPPAQWVQRNSQSNQTAIR